MTPLQLAAILALSLMTEAPRPTNPEPDAVDRVIKRFDFDEQRLGNFESFPRGWRPIYGPGYPRFLEARFDRQIGHNAAPSFKFPLGGGSVGATYSGQDIPVNPSCEYRVSAWIRTENLVHGSARLSAYYLDQSLNKILESERSAAAMPGENHDDRTWRLASIDLPAGFDNARWIGLTCRVEQSGSTNAPRPIEYHDIHAAAWFDDIRIVRIPRLILRMTAGDNIFNFDEPVACIARVLDLDGHGIEARLELSDAEDRLLQTHSIYSARPDQPQTPTPLDGLPPGFYKLQLIVTTGPDVVETRRLTFIRLGPDLRSHASSSPGLAVDLSDIQHLAPATLIRLVQQLGVHAVTLRLWREDTTAEQILHGQPEIDKLLGQLADARIAVTAILSEVPKDLRKELEKPGTVFDVLSAAPSRWRAYVTMLTARYAERVAVWQIGDGAIANAPPIDKIQHALESFRAEAKSVIGPSRIALAWPVTCDLPSASLPADVLNLGVPDSIAALSLTGYLDHFASFGGARRVVISSPRDRSGNRTTVLGEWARRLIIARSSGVEIVSVPQPWSIACTDEPPVLEERFLIERTISQSLDGMRSVGPLWLGEDLEAHLFMDDRGVGGLALWRPAEEAKSAPIDLDAGIQARMIDVWGGAGALEDGACGRRAMIGSLPVILAPIDARELQTLASLDIDSPGLRADIHPQERTLSFTNHQPDRLIGRIRLVPPAGWRIEPENLKVNLSPGQSLQSSLSMTTPSNAGAGDYLLRAQVHVDGPSPRVLWARTPLRIASPGLDVRLVTEQQAGALHVIQRITNQTTRLLQLRSSLVCPDHLRQDRFIHDLPPGETVLREFVIPDPQALRGQWLRASVEEIDGILRIHQVMSMTD